MSADTLEFDVRLEFDDFTLDVESRVDINGVTALFGPSGSGKSTLLRTLAGLESTATGVVRLGDAIWLDSERGIRLPPHKRPVGYMFQDARLFPHLNVRGNLSYAEKRTSANRIKNDARPAIAFDEVVDALDLADLLRRKTSGLSGGERQRVALGRTLLAQPDLLLLDEPLSALDPRRKMEILPYVEQLHPRFGIPTLYVSHAIDEVGLLAEHILVLSGGDLVAQGRTAEVFDDLELQPLGESLDRTSIVEARVTQHDPEYHLTWLDLAGQTLSVPAIPHLEVGQTARLIIGARDVSLATKLPESLSIRNVLEGIVEEIAEDRATAFAEVLIDLGQNRLRARITRASLDDLELRVGSPVYALLKSVSLESRLSTA